MTRLVIGTRFVSAAVPMLSLLAFAADAAAGPGRYRECDGHIIETSSDRQIAFEALAPRLAQADFILLGERHGTVAHARAAACVLDAVASARPAALVMEILTTADQPTIAAWRKAHPESAGGLGAQFGWSRRGWPAFGSWLPLLDAAFRQRIALYGGDLPDGERRAPAADERDVAARFGARGNAFRASWSEAMVTAYCGLLPREVIRQRALTQIRRDLSIATVASRAGSKGEAVLVQVGRGHARKDRSLHAALSQSSVRITSIGFFTETEMTVTADGKFHDYVWVAGVNHQEGVFCPSNGPAARMADGEGE